MKIWIVMLLVLLGFSLLPSQGTELSELRPVSLLVIRAGANGIQIQTDTNDRGEGQTLQAALRNLEATTAGHIFLDTVENLIVEEETKHLLPELKQQLRPGVRVCVTDGELNPEAVSEYLKSHIPMGRLADLTGTSPLEKLSCTEERYFIERS